MADKARRKKPRAPERSEEPNPEISALAERTVISAALITPGFWETVMRLPEPEDFDDTNLGALWTAIRAVQRRSPLTRIAIQRELREMGWGEADAFAALAGADARYLPLPEAVAAAQTIMDRRLRRQATTVLSENLEALATVHDVQDLVHRCEVAITDLASRSDGADDFKRGHDVKEERLERLETGLREIDEVSGGLPCAVLTIIAARTGMGKTAIATTLLRNVAKRGIAAGINSLEMPSLDLIHRAAAAEAFDPRLEANPQYSDYETRHLEGEMLERFESAKAAIRKLPIYWDDKQGRTSTHIRLGGRRLRMRAGQEGFDLRLLIVDHMGKILPDRDHDNRAVELGKISNGLMLLANEIKIPVVALAQLNRGVENRTDKRPLINDLRDSGQLEEDAHTIMMLYRQAYYDDQARERGEEVDEDKMLENRNILECNIVKNRGGPLRRVRLFCDIGCNAILDRAYATAHKLRASQKDMFG